MLLKQNLSVSVSSFEFHLLIKYYILTIDPSYLSVVIS